MYIKEQIDISGLYLENFITTEMRNVTLTVLEGEVYYETDHHQESEKQKTGTHLATGSSVIVETGVFHRVHTLGSRAACYMYTYTNRTKEENGEIVATSDTANIRNNPNSPFPLVEDIATRMDRIRTTLAIIGNSFLNVFYNVPMIRRTRLYSNSN